MTNPPNGANTCAIAVTYNPDATFLSALASLRLQVERIVVVDNRSSEAGREFVRETCAAFGAEVIDNRFNMGIGVALNQGIAAAMESEGCEWVLLLDQDSVPSEEMIVQMSAIFEGMPNREGVAIIGANFLERGLGQLGFRSVPSDKRDWVYGRSMQTSGTLLSVEAYRRVGAMREDFFMYWIDVEYCLRIRALGMRIVISTQPLMAHATGQSSKRQFLGYSFESTNYPPNRHYYLVRNHVALVRTYCCVDPKWALSSIRQRSLMILQTFVFEPGRVERAKYVFLGLVDGMRMNFARSPLAHTAKPFS